MQRLNMYSSDYQQFGNDYKNTPYLQDPKAVSKISKRGAGSKHKNGKAMSRRLKSGHSNNRPHFNVYSTGTSFIDPAHPQHRKKTQNRGKSFKNRERGKEKPYTAQNKKRRSYLNENTSDGNIKESYIANIKQNLEKEKDREDINASTISEMAAAKGSLPSVDHEESKRKIDNLMFRPYDENSGHVSMKNKNLPLNAREPEAPNSSVKDGTTFDNRKTTDKNKLICKKNRGKGKPMPNQSMRNLNKNDEVLPIYKRRAYNKGPIKIGDTGYMKRPLKTHYSSKRQNNWVHEQMNISGDENTNELNQHKPIRARVLKAERQRSDFRINRTKTKPRGRTAQGPRNQGNNSMVGPNPSGHKNPSSTLQTKDNVPNMKPKRSQNLNKRAYSQNQENKKSSEKKPKRVENGQTDLNDQQDGEYNSYSPSKSLAVKQKKDRDFAHKSTTNGDDVESMIRMAEAKMKATAEAMVNIHMADEELDKKIESLNDFESSHDNFQHEDGDYQGHIGDKSTEGMTRQEKIANIVNDLVAKNADLDIPEDITESDSDHQNLCQEQNSEAQDTLLGFSDTNLDCIKEQVTEEIHVTSRDDSRENSQQQEKTSMIFEKQQNDTKDHKVHETPAFGHKDPFSNFLCSNEVATPQKEVLLVKKDPEMQIFKENASKKISPEFDHDYDINKLIKLQSLFRQILAQRKLKEMKQRSNIIQQQRSLTSNKRKIIALRSITRVWLLYKEAKIAAEKCTYLDENAKSGLEEPYHYYCDTMNDLKYIEVQFRQRIFKRAREYLKTIPYECRQSYVKLIDCKIYQREMNNKLKVMQKVAEAKKKQLYY
ncbi:unnamed protein product [Moneuplotes crassus]|uniref:Uncharacterized protein n=2 Tax=Euplotes crassus TaxID=5936 RepID=A0AAD1Y7N7_EUPCR|nr:unnamed protein product [Moneuplotes crassus]